MKIPILKQIREGGDIGRPVILESNLEISNTFLNLSKNLVSAVNYRNENLKPTKKVEIHNKDVQNKEICQNQKKIFIKKLKKL